MKRGAHGAAILNTAPRIRTVGGQHTRTVWVNVKAGPQP